MSLSPTLAAFDRYPDYRFRLNDALEDASSEDLAETSVDDNGQAVLDLNLQRFANSTYRLQVMAQVFEAEGTMWPRKVPCWCRPHLSSGCEKSGLAVVRRQDAPRQVQWLAVAPTSRRWRWTA
jgi:uncharacterized protein YfaS (alpha-2-macroglobulin family)